MALTPADTYNFTRKQLLQWGGLMIGICAAFVALFPLWPAIDRPGAMLDLEMMLKSNKPLILVYVAGLLGMFYAYWRIVRLLHQFPAEYAEEEKRLRVWVIAIGLACGSILLVLYPITAIDSGLYVVRARLWTLYGANPMTALPASFPKDPYIKMAGEFSKEVSPYGPLWELIAQIPLRMGFVEMDSGIIAMKIISLGAYAGMAILLGWHARQDKNYQVGGATLAAFFALNPMTLLEAIGNGHNDMLALFLLTSGLILWQRDRWAWATLLFAFSTLVKITGVILLPIFGVALLINAPGWNIRAKRGIGSAAIFLIVSLACYRVMGPFPEIFEGVQKALFGRQGYSPAYALLALSWDVLPAASRYMLPGSRYLFAAYYAYLLIALAIKRLTFIEAGFLAYFSQLLFGAVFRIWYPLWLLPFAALGLNSRAYWRTFLFSLTAELSILIYYVLWRWTLKNFDWGKTTFGHSWDYWRVTTIITAPWTFGLPLLGDYLGRRKNRERFDNALQV